MLSSLFIALSLCVSAILAVPSTDHKFACGTHKSPADILAAEAHFAANRVEVSNASDAAAVTIQILWHIIMADTTYAGGNVPDSQITAQMNLLNTKYNPYGIQWYNAGIRRHTNANWFHGVAYGNAAAAQMKATLHAESPNRNVLHVYVTELNFGRDLGGWSSFPYDYPQNPNDDGVVITYVSLPGGSARPPFNNGMTTVHEAGHWLGLYHTFQGSCYAPGDYVDDTAPEASASVQGCGYRDSCPGGGPDPNNNYMDYSYGVDGSCGTNITPGQVARIKSMCATYRGIYI